MTFLDVVAAHAAQVIGAAEDQRQEALSQQQQAREALDVAMAGLRRRARRRRV